MKFFIIFSFFFMNPFSIVEANPKGTCREWFEKAGLKPGPNCESSCATTKVGLSTFYCPSQCVELCEAQQSSSKYEKISSTLLGRMLYYPGLTDSETKLVKKFPKDAIVVFIQKERAEASTERNFPNGSFNDESDAFRHFVWAGLLTKELDAEKAKLFLDAHENDPRQPEAEKAMDLANNRGGILAAQQLEMKGRLQLRDLESEALRELREKGLSVLNPGLTMPREPK